MTVGEKIHQIRNSFGLSLREFADRIGSTTHTTIARLESNVNQDISLGLIKTICDCFNYDFVNFLIETGYIAKPKTCYVPILSKYNSLNEDGKQKAENYIDDLISSGKYFDEISASILEKNFA